MQVWLKDSNGLFLFYWKRSIWYVSHEYDNIYCRMAICKCNNILFFLILKRLLTEILCKIIKIWTLLTSADKVSGQHFIQSIWSCRTFLKRRKSCGYFRSHFIETIKLMRFTSWQWLYFLLHRHHNQWFVDWFDSTRSCLIK